MLEIICFISILLFYLFETDGLISYLEYFQLSKYLPYYSEYKNIIKNNGKVNYLKFVNRSTDNFWLKLLSCPICSAVPISLIISFLNMISFPVVLFGGLIGYFILKRISSVN